MVFLIFFTQLLSDDYTIRILNDSNTLTSWEATQHGVNCTLSSNPNENTVCKHAQDSASDVATNILIAMRDDMNTVTEFDPACNPLLTPLQTINSLTFTVSISLFTPGDHLNTLMTSAGVSFDPLLKSTFKSYLCDHATQFHQTPLCFNTHSIPLSSETESLINTDLESAILAAFLEVSKIQPDASLGVLGDSSLPSSLEVQSIEVSSSTIVLDAEQGYEKWMYEVTIRSLSTFASEGFDSKIIRDGPDLLEGQKIEISTTTTSSNDERLCPETDAPSETTFRQISNWLSNISTHPAFDNYLVSKWLDGDWQDSVDLSRLVVNGFPIDLVVNGFENSEALYNTDRTFRRNVWNPDCEYSFLNVDAFDYWVKAFEGYTPWSEADTTWRLNQDASTEAIEWLTSKISAVDSVTVDSNQIISIAKWLFTWIDHPVVDGYVLNQWLASRDASGVNLGHVCENNQVYNGYMPALQCSITEGDGFGFELSKTYEGVDEYMMDASKREMSTITETDAFHLEMSSAAYLFNHENEHSFLNPVGIKTWKDIALNGSDKTPLIDAIPTSYTPGSPPTPTTDNTATGSLSVTNNWDQMFRWVKSWTVNPITQQTILHQWTHGYDAPLETVLDSSNGAFYSRVFPSLTENDGHTATVVYKGFELCVDSDTSDCSVSKSITNEIASLVFDFTNSLSILNDDGFATWVGLFVECSTTTSSTAAECDPTIDLLPLSAPSPIPGSRVPLGKWLQLPETEKQESIQTKMMEVLTGENSELIIANIRIWLEKWLDQQTFRSYMLSTHSLSDVLDLGFKQWSTGLVSMVSSGKDTLRELVSRRIWSIESSSIIDEELPKVFGGLEINSFCKKAFDYNDRSTRKQFEDSSSRCTVLNTEPLPTTAARQLLIWFSDMTIADVDMRSPLHGFTDPRFVERSGHMPFSFNSTEYELLKSDLTMDDNYVWGDELKDYFNSLDSSIQGSFPKLGQFGFTKGLLTLLAFREQPIDSSRMTFCEAMGSYLNEIGVFVDTGSYCTSLSDGIYFTQFTDLFAHTTSVEAAIKDLQKYLTYIRESFIMEPSIEKIDPNLEANEQFPLNGGVFTTQSVYSLSFGYSDSTVTPLSNRNILNTANDYLTLSNESNGKLALPIISKYNQPQAQTIVSGIKDETKVGKMYNWRNSGGIDIWSGAPRRFADEHILDATQLTPTLLDGSKPNEVNIWSNLLQRTIRFTYQKEVTRYGVSCRRYILLSLDGSSAKSDSTSELVDLSIANGGLPYVVSRPFFLSGDDVEGDLLPSVTVKEKFVKIAGIPLGDEFIIDGTTVDMKNYFSYIDVEPRTGAVWRSKIRFQLNVKLPSRDSNVLSRHMTDAFPFKSLADGDASEAIIPMFLVDQQSVIPKSVADEYKSDIDHSLRNSDLSVLSGIVLCVIALITAGILFAKALSKKAELQGIKGINQLEEAPLFPYMMRSHIESNPARKHDLALKLRGVHETGGVAGAVRDVKRIRNLARVKASQAQLERNIKESEQALHGGTHINNVIYNSTDEYDSEEDSQFEPKEGLEWPMNDIGMAAAMSNAMLDREELMLQSPTPPPLRSHNNNNNNNNPNITSSHASLLSNPVVIHDSRMSKSELQVPKPLISGRKPDVRTFEDLNRSLLKSTIHHNKGSMTGRPEIPENKKIISPKALNGPRSRSLVLSEDNIHAPTTFELPPGSPVEKLDAEPQIGFKTPTKADGNENKENENNDKSTGKKSSKKKSRKRRFSLGASRVVPLGVPEMPTVDANKVAPLISPIITTPLGTSNGSSTPKLPPLQPLKLTPSPVGPSSSSRASPQIHNISSVPTLNLNFSINMAETPVDPRKNNGM
eukprot:TRINITY_DN2023_c0_g1_i2.p1 TRINITY_DN2023_c0_g1~~TRINITY_DN2023_c0_g1_i2.p1  ORF type:complete len:1838 (+),score=506.71 TRINITY_DN2023_c0_g1_i2:9-5522(+)